MKFITDKIVSIKGQDYDHIEIVDICSYSTIDREFVYRFRIQRNFNGHIYKLDEFENVVTEEGISGSVRVHGTNEVVPIINYFMANGSFDGCTILNIGYPKIGELPMFLTKDDSVEDIINPQVHPTNAFVAWWLTHGVKYRGKTLAQLGFQLDVSNYNF